MKLGLTRIDDATRADPRHDSPEYRSTELRSPRRPLLLLPSSLTSRSLT